MGGFYEHLCGRDPEKEIWNQEEETKPV